MSEEMIPHYQLPNASSTLGPYSNSEQDVIKSAFSRALPYTLLKQLPNQLKANYVLEAKANYLDANLTGSMSGIKPHGSYKRIAKFGLFSEFEYMPSEYGLDKRVQEREKAVKEYYVQHDAPFVVSTNKPQPDPLGEPNPHEFHDTMTEYMSDPYELAHDAAQREEILSRNNIVAGPFLPGGKSAELLSGNRSHLPDIVQVIGQELDMDWGDCEFDMYCDEEDLIIMQFKLNTVDSTKGLLAYMNMLLKRHPIVSQYGLSKIVELWNHTPDDGCVYYALKPSWVRRANNAIKLRPPVKKESEQDNSEKEQLELQDTRRV